MATPMTQIPTSPSRRVSLPRTVMATVFPKLDHDEVCFGASGHGRDILLSVLEDKPDFMQLVHRLRRELFLALTDSFISWRRV